MWRALHLPLARVHYLFISRLSSSDESTMLSCESDEESELEERVDCEEDRRDVMREGGEETSPIRAETIIFVIRSEKQLEKQTRVHQQPVTASQELASSPGVEAVVAVHRRWKRRLTCATLCAHTAAANSVTLHTNNTNARRFLLPTHVPIH